MNKKLTRGAVRAAIIGVIAMVIGFGTVTPAAAGGFPKVFIGAPTASAWPTPEDCEGQTFPSAACSQPGVHRWMMAQPKGDWATDLKGVVAGQPVKLYAGFDPIPGSEAKVTAKVTSIRTGCDTGVEDAGLLVTVTLFANDYAIGTVSFANIESGLKIDDVIDPAGGLVGTVGGYGPSACWPGPQVHVQMSSTDGYSCFNGSLAPGQQLSERQWIGVINNTTTSDPGQSCGVG